MRYDPLLETAEIKVADSYVTFSRKFKYLGSRISYNLRDDDDINARHAAASHSMGALTEYGATPTLTRTASISFSAQSLSIFFYGVARTGLYDNPYFVNSRFFSIEIFDGYSTSR